MPGMYCAYCDRYFESSSDSSQYCSQSCTKKAEAKRRGMKAGRQLSFTNEVPAGTRGAAHELLVCVVLMRYGYHVFRAQSPHAPFDLIAMKAERIWRIEVRTLNLSATTISWKKSLNPQFDLYAVVDHLGQVMFFDLENNTVDLLPLDTAQPAANGVAA